MLSISMLQCFNASMHNCGYKIVRPGEQTPFPPEFGMTYPHPQQALYQTVGYAVFVILVVVVDVDAVFVLIFQLQN